MPLAKGAGLVHHRVRANNRPRWLRAQDSRLQRKEGSHGRRPQRVSIASAVPSENLVRWIRSRKENRIMIETDGDLLQTSARIYVGLLSFA